MAKTKVKLNMLNCPAADRNKEPILEVLKQYLEPLKSGAVLEIGSGSGQHVTFFAPHFPNLTFYPSDIEEKYLESVGNLTKYTRCTNVRQPITFNAGASLAEWNFFTRGCFDAIYCSNVIHISSTDTVNGIFKAAGHLLKPEDGVLIIYGPFSKDGIISPESNVDFDKHLRSQNEDWGLRDVKNLKDLAEKASLQFLNMHNMPANNDILVWRRNSDP